MKTCRHCRIEKENINFYTHATTKDHLSSWCRQCNCQRKKDLRLNPEIRLKLCAVAARYRKDYPEEVKRGIRNSTLKKKYGITSAEYDKMFEAQGNVCAVCGSGSSQGYGRMHVDHCHTTGVIRGILCQPCNTSIGKMKDNPELIKKLASYVEVYH